MQGLILAAGEGKRLDCNTPKPLVEVCGQMLLERSIHHLAHLGVRELVVVVGYQAQRIKDFFSGDRRSIPGCDIVWVENKDYKRGNGLSVLCARDYLNDYFLVSMVDHLYDPGLLTDLVSLRGDLIAVVDSNPKFVDPDEATRVFVRRGRIKRIGKNLKRYNALDCGIFLCSKNIFPVLAEGIEEGEDEWNHAKQRFARRHTATVYDLKGGFWVDVDTQEELEVARRLLRQTPHFIWGVNAASDS